MGRMWRGSLNVDCDRLLLFIERSDRSLQIDNLWCSPIDALSFVKRHNVWLQSLSISHLIHIYVEILEKFHLKICGAMTTQRAPLKRDGLSMEKGGSLCSDHRLLPARY